MPNACADIQATLSTYLDGELQDADLREFESHVSDCESCQQRIEEADIAHSALRSHLRATPPASDFLHKKIQMALDQEEALQRQAQRRSWLSLPSAATAIATAALALFAWGQWQQQTASTTQAVASSQVTRDVARLHLRESPLFVTNDRNTVGRGAAEFLEIPVEAPQFSSRGVKLVGWTPAQVNGKQSATFVYEVANATGRHRVHVHAVALADIDLRSQTKLELDGAVLWVDSAYGFNTVTYAGRGRLAYVFSSDMSIEDLAAMVVRTDIANTL